MKEYTFETQEIDGKNEIVLCLKDFPDVKFKFKSIRFGDVDEDHQVPVLFEIDLIDENQSFPEIRNSEIKSPKFYWTFLLKWRGENTKLPTPSAR